MRDAEHGSAGAARGAPARGTEAPEAPSTRGTPRARHALRAGIPILLGTAFLLASAAAAFGQAKEGDKVQLNFNGVNLKEVVKAVEKLSGKRFLFDEVLLAEKRVNLFSSHPVPAERILEVFESILEVEGLTLVRSGEGEAELWKIVDLATAMRRPTPTFGSKDLAALRPGDQIVTLLLPLLYAVPEDVVSVVRSMATLPEGVLAVPGTTMIRVTDFAGNAKRIAALVEEIDKEGPKVVAETVVLQNVDPVQLAEEIRPLVDVENRLEMNRLQRGIQQQMNQLAGRGGQQRQPQAIQVSGARYAPIAVTPVPRLGAVIVSAEESRIKPILEMIQRLDVSDPQQRVVQYYPLKYADPTSAASILSGVFDITVGGTAARARGGRGAQPRAAPSPTAARKSASIIPDEDLKVLVVVAPQKTQEEIRAVLENLDKAGPNENVLRIYEVQHADVREAAAIAARLFGMSLESDVARQRMAAAARRGGQPVITQEEVVIADENLGALLIVAPPPLHEKVAEALAKIDVEGPGIQEVRGYDLKYADADEVAAALGSLFDLNVGRGAAGRGRGGFAMTSQAQRTAVIVPNRAQSKVLVSASAEVQKEVADVIRQLDIEGPAESVVRYVPVEIADVREVASMVAQAFGLQLGAPGATPAAARGGRGGQPAAAVSVVIPDENLGSLMVVATREAQEKIAEAVRKMDVAGPGEKVVRFYKLDRADVNEAARIVSGIFEIDLATGTSAAAQRGRTGRGAAAATRTQRNAVVIPHPDLSSVVVVAPKTTQEEVERILKQIDTSGPLDNELRYYPLRYADPLEAANTVSQIFGLTVGSPQRAWRPTGAAARAGTEEERRVLTKEKMVIPDETLNSLVVVAPPDVQAEIAKTVARMDVQGPQDNELRFYEVDDDFADTTARTLGQIFNIPVGSSTQARTIRATTGTTRVKYAQNPVIIPDAAFSSIIVNAPPEIHEQILKVLEQLKLLGRQERMAIRFYKLKNTDAEEIANKIGSLFKITVSTVPTTTSTSTARRTTGSTGTSARRTTTTTPRRTTTSRTDGETPEGAAAVGQDEEGGGGGKPDEEEPPVPAGPVKEYSWGGEPVIVPDKNLNSIIAIAPEYLHAEIEKILATLDVRRPQVMFEVAIIDLTADQDLDIGFEFSTIDPSSDNARGHGFTSFGIGNRSGNAGGGMPATTTVPAGQSGIFGAISKGAAGSLPVLIKLLQQNSDVNIRSTPLLLVNDNMEAEFSSLRSEPTTSISQGTATTHISFAGFVDAGTVLRITPHVSEGNYIRLEMHLQVDSWIGASSVEGIPPPKATNTIDTAITVPNERWVIIGGLKSTSRTESVDKVPLLGDIPLLGYLFRREITIEKSTKLFLFIKPSILSDETFVDLNRISDRKMEEARTASGEKLSLDKPEGEKAAEEKAEEKK